MVAERGADHQHRDADGVVGSTSNRELQELPFTFRTQNTSPILAIQVIPEVQRVNQQFSLSGSLPYQNEVSVDGILTTSVRRNGIGAEGFNIFPSIESIEEIKVSSINNTAEYAQLGDITTISGPGTNDYHGTAFWNYNSERLNANPNYFNPSLKPNTSDNHNFGGSLGGRLVRNRTFFFATFERLDIKLFQSAAATVPQAAFRRGDFSALATPIIDPVDRPAVPRQRDSGQPHQPGGGDAAADLHPGAERRRGHAPLRDRRHREVEPVRRARRSELRARPHALRPVELEGTAASDADDLREPRAARRSTTRCRPSCVSDNYARVVEPAQRGAHRLHEGRSGLHRPAGSGSDLVERPGLRLLSQNLPGGTGTTYVDIAGYTRFGESQEEPLTQDTFQVADSLTWIRGNHTIKAGFDVQWFNWTSPVNFTGADDFGVFRFNNNIVGGGTGNPVANFLLGIPTDVDQTASGPNVDGVATHYSVFVQDEWRVNAERHAEPRPALRPAARLRGSRGQHQQLPARHAERRRRRARRGVARADLAGLRAARSAARASSPPTRPACRCRCATPTSNNIAPRLGVAWRPGGDTRTVIRAGYGIYYTRLLGAVFNSLTGIHTSDNVTFPNASTPTTRTYGIVWPNTFAGDPSRGVTRVGTQNFSTANDPDFKDPRTQQWSLTFERELNRRNAVRVTYSGFRSTDLTMAPDLNQIQPNTIGFANLPAEARPFPNWNRINTRDNGGYQNYHDVLFQVRGTLAALGSDAHSQLQVGALDRQHRGSRRRSERLPDRDQRPHRQPRSTPTTCAAPTDEHPDHRFVSSLIWNIPVGRDRAYRSSTCRPRWTPLARRLDASRA